MKHCHLLSILLCLLLGCAEEAKVEPVQPSSPSPATLKVMTYNIRIARGLEGPINADVIAQNIPKIAEFIRDSGADIVLLQSIDVGTYRTNNMNQPQQLAKLTGMEAAFGIATKAYGGDYGIAILSRYPIRDIKIHKLFKPDYSDRKPPVPTWWGEQRAAMAATIDTPAGPVRIINTHLGFTEDQREVQLQEIADLIRNEPKELPIIFGGDLFTDSHEKVLQPIRDLMQSPELPGVYTYTTLDPTRTIDHLFFTTHFTILQATTSPVMFSDHFPLIAEVKLP